MLESRPDVESRRILVDSGDGDYGGVALAGFGGTIVVATLLVEDPPGDVLGLRSLSFSAIRSPTLRSHLIFILAAGGPHYGCEFTPTLGNGGSSGGRGCRSLLR
jgi:hypothetical protein